ncbi:hypothetical protein GBA52_006896 [Prunus armeniaca]|nr:hypothetical protein GBA52_006896 [Prunus armeniaca]
MESVDKRDRYSPPSVDTITTVVWPLPNSHQNGANQAFTVSTIGLYEKANQKSLPLKKPNKCHIAQ